MPRVNDAPQLGVIVVSTLQFAWGITASDSLSASLGRLNSLFSLVASNAISGFTENSGHSEWMPSPGAQLFQEARKLTTQPPSANSTRQHSKKENVMLNPAHEIQESEGWRN